MEWPRSSVIPWVHFDANGAFCTFCGARVGVWAKYPCGSRNPNDAVWTAIDEIPGKQYQKGDVVHECLGALVAEANRGAR